MDIGDKVKVTSGKHKSKIGVIIGRSFFGGMTPELKNGVDMKMEVPIATIWSVRFEDGNEQYVVENWLELAEKS